VQIQSKWFPLCDRNPQMFAAKIFKSTQCIYPLQGRAAYIDLSRGAGKTAAAGCTLPPRQNSVGLVKAQPRRVEI
jgi:hypothetical protein